MPPKIHDVGFLQKQILGALTEMRDHHKIPLIFYSKGLKIMMFGSENLMHWLEERKDTDKFQTALDDDILHLTDTEAAPPAARPTNADLTRFFTSNEPAKLPFPLRVMTYGETWNWLSKYFFNL